MLCNTVPLPLCCQSSIPPEAASSLPRGLHSPSLLCCCSDPHSTCSGDGGQCPSPPAGSQATFGCDEGYYPCVANNACIPSNTCCSDGQCGDNAECSEPGGQCRCKTGECRKCQRMAASKPSGVLAFRVGAGWMGSRVAADPAAYLSA